MHMSIENKESIPFREKFDRGTYVVYELFENEKWGAALIEIEDSPRHYHKIEREIFVVVHGKLDIEIDGAHHFLQAGESITVLPNQIHHLKSANREAVRVLCLSFPPFSPSDLYTV